jgi:hypothetical protein
MHLNISFNTETMKNKVLIERFLEEEEEEEEEEEV